MPTVINNMELKGRLWLWYSAISHAHMLLELASRSRAAINQPNIKERDEETTRKFHEFRNTQPDNKEGEIYLNHLVLFNSIYAKEFPEITECFSMYNACIELAIIYFCQILSPGNSDPGNAAKNDKNYLIKISENFFQSQEEINKFNNLCNELRTARDKMLGHADAKAFSIKHGEQISSMKLHSQAWKDIDIDYWHGLLEGLAKAILEYSNEKSRK